MKLASLKQGRDGKLALVNLSLTKMSFVDEVAPTLQAALNNWPSIEKTDLLVLERS